MGVILLARRKNEYLFAPQREKRSHLGAWLVVLALLAGALAGGIWGMIPGVLKITRGQNEMIISIMLNYVATLLMGVIYTSWIRDASVPQTPAIDEDGVYTTKDDVALYLHTYGHLPSNFITKKEAEKLGWSGGSLEPYAPGKCIGGSHFGNYEGMLPEKDGRSYTECDIDTLGADKRGAKRIVFSNDGLIYYTEDHYETFELLYGEES